MSWKALVGVSLLTMAISIACVGTCIANQLRHCGSKLRSWIDVENVPSFVQLASNGVSRGCLNAAYLKTFGALRGRQTSMFSMLTRAGLTPEEVALTSGDRAAWSQFQAQAIARVDELSAGERAP